MKQQYLKRFQKSEKDDWAKRQDLRETALAEKYPNIFRKVSESFYGCLNDMNTPEACFKHLIQGRLPKKIEKDFSEGFGRKFEQGSRKR